MNESSFCSITSPAFGVLRILDVGHSNKCVVVYYCFNLHFPNDIWEKTLESPLDCKEIQRVHPKGDQS